MNISKDDWSERCGKLLSAQLKNEYVAYYTYRAISAHFSKPSIELPGLAKKYYKMAKEELDHANGIIDFMNSKGLNITFYDISLPSAEFKTINDIIKLTIDLEESVSRTINDIYKEADAKNDYGVMGFLDPYVEEQIESIKELNCMAVNAKRCVNEIDIFIYDQSFLKK